MHSPSTAFILRLCVSGLVAGLAACSTTPTPTPTPDVPPVQDVPVVSDAPACDGRPSTPAPRKNSPLYGPCFTTDECEPGLTCRSELSHGFPGGQCSLECTNSEPCARGEGVDGYCPPATADGSPRFCQRVCINGIACQREGYTCQTLNGGTLREVRVCIPICTDASCENGTVCNHESGRCRGACATAPTGRTLGQTCEPRTRMGANPSNFCQSDLCQADWAADSLGNRVYTGWNGGMCTARCILPQGYNSSTFWDEDTDGGLRRLPRANCPMNSICAPNGSFAEGDLGICLPECRSNADCRESDGYYCRNSFQLAMTQRYANGYCVPRNCLSSEAAQRGCATGLTCRRNSNGTGTCVPATMTP